MKTCSDSHNSRVGRSAPPRPGLVFQRVSPDSFVFSYNEVFSVLSVWLLLTVIVDHPVANKLLPPDSHQPQKNHVIWTNHSSQITANSNSNLVRHENVHDGNKLPPWWDLGNKLLPLDSLQPQMISVRRTGVNILKVSPGASPFLASSFLVLCFYDFSFLDVHVQFKMTQHQCIKLLLALRLVP